MLTYLVLGLAASCGLRVAKPAVMSLLPGQVGSVELNTLIVLSDPYARLLSAALPWQHE